jgi:hypothetical protein
MHHARRIDEVASCMNGNSCQKSTMENIATQNPVLLHKVLDCTFEVLWNLLFNSLWYGDEQIFKMSRSYSPSYHSRPNCRMQSTVYSAADLLNLLDLRCTHCNGNYIKQQSLIMRYQYQYYRYYSRSLRPMHNPGGNIIHHSIVSHIFSAKKNPFGDHR